MLVWFNYDVGSLSKNVKLHLLLSAYPIWVLVRLAKIPVA